MVPKSIQDNRGEISRAAQKPASPNSNAMVRIRRLSSLRVGVTIFVSINPLKNPITKAIILYNIGKNILKKERSPEALVLINAVAILKAIRHTASSKATTCKRVFTKFPRARYWRIVAMVLAGAVAVAIAPNNILKSHSSPKI